MGDVECKACRETFATVKPARSNVSIPGRRRRCSKASPRRSRCSGSASEAHSIKRSAAPTRLRALRGRIACFTRNVKRWQGGAMLLRWVGAAVLQAALGFRHLRGYRDIQTLCVALERQFKTNLLDRQAKAA